MVGLVRNYTDRYPEGMQRVALLSDPTRALGSLAEPECTRIIAALDLAEELGVPVEWFALSAGAKIAMDSGTENMDWIAAVLRRIIEFTQRGGELNVVVTGINVGAQPYWNAEATMLMHTRGILVMTPESAMVLTGKQALDYSGGVSAEDNFGIGGYERIMGPNGQAQYWAPDLAGACRVLLVPLRAHLRGARRALPAPRRDLRSDRARRAQLAPLRARVGPARGGRDLLGRDESRPQEAVRHPLGDAGRRSTATTRRSSAGPGGARRRPPWCGTPTWAAGRYPCSASSLGRCRAMGRCRPTVPSSGPRALSSRSRRARSPARSTPPAAAARWWSLANLAGFDGSPESMARWQLEYGAEIGRAVVNFRGPIVFCVVSRYHGGAFVVFSQRLNDDLEAVALEGSHASVIGGAPAAAVVFAHGGQSAARLRTPGSSSSISASRPPRGRERQRLRAERAAAWSEVHAQRLGELAAEFDSVHSVERALRDGIGQPHHRAPPRCGRS